MNSNLLELQADIMEKRRGLEETRKELELQFAGLDLVLDEVFETAGFWYLFPELQERPMVITMRGHTGVGKTSIVR